jgi:hypothetical protein
LRQGIRIRGQWYPILKMDWIDGVALNTYVEKHLMNPGAIQALAHNFLKLTSDLRRHSIAHGDLQHGNLLVVNGDIRLIDYDGMFVPGFEGMQSYELGHRNYQHPRRSERDFGPNLDHFSAWVIYISLSALAIEPRLWRRLGAGDEYLLFRLEDFENPHASPALRALEEVGDSRVQALMALFRSLAYRELGEIPPLDVGALPLGQAAVAQTYAQARSDWWAGQRPPAAVAQAAVAEAAPNTPRFGWVLDYIEPVAAVRISASYTAERSLLTGFVVMAVLLMYAAIAGSVAPTLAAAGIAAGATLLLTGLGIRFRLLPEAARKSELASDLASVQREIERMEEVIRRDHADLERRERKKTGPILAKQQGVMQKVQSGVKRIEAQAQKGLAKIDGQLHVLDQAEAQEMTRTLQNAQSQFVYDRLAEHALLSANIAGLGASVKLKLILAGVRTAADILNVQNVGGWQGQPMVTYILTSDNRRVRIQGIGPKKAAALLAWRRNLESQIRPQVPRSLPAPQEAALRSKYQARRQTLDVQRAGLQRSADQQMEAVRAKYRKEQDKWGRRLFEAQQEFAKQRQALEGRTRERRKTVAEKHWAAARLQRELEAYRQVTFGGYLRRIVLL